MLLKKKVYLGLSLLFILALNTTLVLSKTTGLTPVPNWIQGVAGSKQPVFVRTDLNGTWFFNPQPVENFWKNTENIPQTWAKIEVPGEWAMQGFTVAPNTAAAYFRDFNIPNQDDLPNQYDLHNQRVKLRCDAIYSDVKIFINGKYAGSHQGGFSPFELDVTELLQIGGENSIALSVKNESLADTLASGTQYAAHQLGGITRKIHLFSVPQLHITSLDLETMFDTQFKNSTLQLKFSISNLGKTESKSGQVKFELTGSHSTGKNKSPVEIKNNILKIPALKTNQVKEFKLKTLVDNPQKWDCEHPNLYNLKTTLFVAGQARESLQQQFGFRQVEVRGNQLFINNQPVKLRGINRHEVHPLRGRSLTNELWRQDAELFRAANINYIRTSHYPPAEEFITACDELGLFVEMEAPLVWIGHNANSTWKKEDPHNSRLFTVISQAILEMVERDRNHPSVIIWSMANESAWGVNWEKAYQLLKSIDSSRPVTFHDQAWGKYNNYGSSILPVRNFHYPGPSLPAKIANNKKPMLFGEYCHLNTYNREEIVTDPGIRDFYGEAIVPMWESMYQSQACLGGAIWSGIDDVFEMPTGKSVGYGSWGPIDGWRRQKPEYWHVKKAYSPVKILSTKIIPPSQNQPLKIEVANRFDFTNFNEIRIEWEIGERNGIVEADLAPRQKGFIEFPPSVNSLINNNYKQKLLLKFHSPQGFLLDIYEIPIRSTEKLEAPKSSPAVKKSEHHNINLVKKADKIFIQGKDFKWEIDPTSGLIINGILAGKKIVYGGPHLMILPLKTGLRVAQYGYLDRQTIGRSVSRTR